MKLCGAFIHIKYESPELLKCRDEVRRRKCAATSSYRGGRRVNPARISAADETKIAGRRVRLHAARQCRRAGTPRAPGSRRVSLHCV